MSAAETGADRRFEGDHWVLKSRMSEIGDASDEVERRLLALGWTDAEMGNFVADVVREAIANAVLHGNLGVKQEGDDEEATELYNTKIKEAEEAPENADKVVIVEVELTADAAVVKVSDSGSGFDVDKIPDPREGDNLHKAKGRGVFSIKEFSDEAQFLDGGRTVVVKKYKDSKKERTP